MDWLKYLIIPLALSALITPFLKIVAYRLDIYAQVNERTVHKGKIARIGGVAIYISFVVCMAVFMKTGYDHQRYSDWWDNHVHRRFDR